MHSPIGGLVIGWCVAIQGLEPTWPENALFAQVGNRYQSEAEDWLAYRQGKRSLRLLIRSHFDGKPILRPSGRCDVCPRTAQICMVMDGGLVVVSRCRETAALIGAATATTTMFGIVVPLDDNDV
jgi:hypothetical protein